MLVVSKREEDIVALHLSIGHLKTCSGLESVLRCEPSTYQPLAIRASLFLMGKYPIVKGVFQSLHVKLSFVIACTILRRRL